MDALVSEVKRLASTADEEGRIKLLDALQDLRASIETPHDTFLRLAFGALQISTIKIGLEMGIFETLNSSSGEMTVDQLAQKSGADISLLSRVLRYLASIGVIKEVGKDKYSASKATKTFSNPAYAGGIHHYHDTLGPCYQSFPKFLADTKYKNITENNKTPFQVGHQTDMPAFIWFPTHPQNMAYFNDYMIGQRGEMPDWLSVFPVEAECANWSKDPEQPLFVDVGGGVGHQCAALRAKYPNLPGRVILQDIPQTLQQALPTPNVEVMVHNFYEPQTVKGAKFYYLRNILHDYPDEQCCTILKNLGVAMAKDSLILIDEMVLPNTGVSDRATILDLTMMVALGSIERTLAEWQALLDMAGFKILRIETYTVSLNDSIIVIVPK